MPVRPAARPGRPRPHRARSGCAAGSAGRWPRAGLRRGAVATRSSARPTSTRSACRPTTPRRHALRLANPLSDEEPLLRTTLLPGLLAALRRNVGRGHRTTSALFEIGPVFRPGAGAAAAPRRGRRSTAGRPTSELAALDAALPAQPRTSPSSLAGPARAGRLVGPGPRRRLGRRRRGGPRRGPRGAASSSTVRARPARAVAPGPLRRAAASDGERRRPRRRAAPAGRRGARPAGAHLRDGARPGRCSAPAADAGARRRAISTFPVGHPGRRARRRRATSRPPRSRRRCATGAGELLESLRLFDVYSGAQVGEGKSRWPTRCASARPTAR